MFIGERYPEKDTSSTTTDRITLFIIINKIVLLDMFVQHIR